ncbi:MAG: DNA translocase FtsK 4TM domain-containing protein [Rhodobacter sp.]|nr:DNA translocase FtsK 4TM domain-containing protein [Rhodobacter sp.]
MATYQARGRGRLLDSKTQAVLERRSKELLGIALFAIGVITTMILGSYVPDDPSWLSVTDQPARNLLGRFGASIASPLFIIVGWGAWAIAMVMLAWGVRFMTHFASEGALARIIFAPIWIALVSVYASTHVPASEWTHSFGLGGLFGDTVLGAILNIAPVSASFGLRVMAFLVALGAVGMGLFVLGFSMFELRRIARFMGVGILLTYASAMTLLGRSARGTLRGAAALRARRAERVEHKRAAAEEAAALAAWEDQQAAAQYHASADADDDIADGTWAEHRPHSLRGLIPGLVKRAPAFERSDREPPLQSPPEEPLYGDDRIKAKIADVIKSRVRGAPSLKSLRQEPPVARPRGPRPMILADVEPNGPPQKAGFPTRMVEPPLSAPAPQAPMAEYVEPLDGDPEEAEDYSDVQTRVLSRPPAEPEIRGVVQHVVRKTPAPSRQAREEAQPRLKFDDNLPSYETPPLSLLTSPVEVTRHHLSDEALEQNARMLESVLDDYGVKGEIVSVRPGPVVTMYELEPAPGLKASRVIGLADDIARSMSALSARVSTVPGRSVIGIELPNANREKVVLREILSARDFGDSNMRLPLALGKDIGGDPIVANLAKMPHLLIAGTTGSGKSVAINTMILSLLYKLSPEECRLIMIDPKMLELSVYDGIPHLLSPVVTDPKKAVVALKWVVGEMEERYRKMSKMGVRNIEGFNGRVEDALSRDEMFSRTVQTGFDDETGEPVFETEEFQPEKIPYIVVIVDEMADLMMVAGKEIEACIQRLAQMARASGIHLIMATQRPSVDVITGTIKANFPTRISFQVTSKIDSRTILGEQGAEQLLGMGDMLYMAGGAKITRVHGPFCSDEEVEEIVNYLKTFGPPDYVGGVVEGPGDDAESDIDLVLGLGGNTDGEDALYDTAVAIVIKDRKCSTSYIQRKLAIGYNKAARLVEQMEDEGLVTPANHVGKREILVPEQH